MLRPQDPLVLMKLTVTTGAWRQIDIAQSLNISQAEIHFSLKRSAAARLYQPEQQRVIKHNLLEFLVHGLQYVLPVELGAPGRGVPTAWCAPPLSKIIVSGSDDMVVWPQGDGSFRGLSIAPIYETAPLAAILDPKLHELLALVDAIRIGRVREREMAEKELTKRLI